MNNRKRIPLFSAAITVLLFLCAIGSALCLTRFSAMIRPASVILTDTVVLLAAVILILALSLKKSLAVTLYSYDNVGYIGGMLFCGLLLAAVVSSWIGSVIQGEETSIRGIFAVVTTFPRRFAMLALPVMALISLALGVSNLALIRHEGFRPKNLLSVLLAAFYIGGTAAIGGIAHVMEQTVTGTPLMRLLNTYVPLFCLLVMCYFECIFAGCVIMSYAAVKTTPRFDKDYIIILGCSIDKRGGLLPLLKGRANRAVRFAWDQEIASGKRCRYVPSGGKGPGEIMSEGSAMELYLLSHGAENDEVYPEKASTDTYENMLFSKKIIDSLTPGASVAFATTNFHVFRSGILARMAGLDAEGVASKTKWYFWPNGFIREFFAILSMNKKAHIAVAAVCGLVCFCFGGIAYLWQLV